MTIKLVEGRYGKDQAQQYVELFRMYFGDKSLEVEYL